MLDLDPTLTRALRDIAEAGNAAARPVPAGHIRERARRDQYRRGVALGAVAVVSVVAMVATTWTLGQGPRTGTPADGKPSLTVAPADFGPSLLLSRDDVASALGTTWDWSAGPVEEPGGALTPCQADAAADPQRTAALSRVVTGGWSGDDTLTEWVERSSDEATAQTAFDRAVGWFTDCGGQGMDESVFGGSLANRFEALPALPGVDQQRVVVRMREPVEGGGSWTNTVAGVVRVGDLLAVVAWDVTVDEDPGRYDDGFLDLMRVAAGRLTGVPAVVVSPDAMVQPSDDAVVAMVGDRARASVTLTREMLRPRLICDGGDAYVPESLQTGRVVTLVDQGATAIITQSMFLFPSKEAASTAIRESRVTASGCSDDRGNGGELSSMAFSEGDESYGVRRGARSSQSLYVVVVRVEHAVSVVAVRELNGTVQEDTVRQLSRALTERMQATYE